MEPELTSPFRPPTSPGPKMIPFLITLPALSLILISLAYTLFFLCPDSFICQNFHQLRQQLHGIEKVRPLLCQDTSRCQWRSLDFRTLPHLSWGTLMEGPACDNQTPHVPLGPTKPPSKCSGFLQTPVLIEAVWAKGTTPQ